MGKSAKFTKNCDFSPCLCWLDKNRFCLCLWLCKWTNDMESSDSIQDLLSENREWISKSREWWTIRNLRQRRFRESSQGVINEWRQPRPHHYFRSVSSQLFMTLWLESNERVEIISFFANLNYRECHRRPWHFVKIESFSRLEKSISSFFHSNNGSCITQFSFSWRPTKSGGVIFRLEGR
jgi:hypothetical protein